MERLVRSCYKKKSGYVFAKKAEDIAREYGIDRIARLASNENPYPLSAAAQKAAEIALRKVNRYPDERTNILTECAQGIRMGITPSSAESGWMGSLRRLSGRWWIPGNRW